MKRWVVSFLVCVGVGSCDPGLSTGPDLSLDKIFGDIEKTTKPLTDSEKLIMNGVYEVVQGSSEVGNPVVGKWVGKRWCIYSQHDVVYSECAGGSLPDSTIKLVGDLRYVRSAESHNVTYRMDSTDGAGEILSGVIPTLRRIRGESDDGKKFELLWRAGIIDTSPFEILAHRGGGRNSDRLGISENSIPMIKYAPFLGATGVEIDVKRTRDDSLILFHDDTFSPRTVQGAYLLGKVEDYDLEQIRSLGKLIHGEQIPTLSEALKAVIDSTKLLWVWLDIKDPREVPQVVRIQKYWQGYAATRGRGDLDILVGIASQEVLDAYMPFADSSDAVVELGIDVATRLKDKKCKVWGPSWTQNVTQEEIDGAKAMGMKVIIWTVDLRESILDQLNKGVDGIVTNYPTLATAIHDSR